jgi:hypothetical protein
MYQKRNQNVARTRTANRTPNDAASADSIAYKLALNESVQKHYGRFLTGEVDTQLRLLIRQSATTSNSRNRRNQSQNCEPKGEVRMIRSALSAPERR